MSALGVALRVARRDTQRHQGRSALIVALVTLPILLGVAADVLVRSNLPTVEISIELDLGAADAWIAAPVGATGVYQVADHIWGFDGINDEASGVPVRPADELLPRFPAGTTLTPWQQLNAPLQLPDGSYASTVVDLIDLTEPGAAGRYTLDAGATPTGPGQIALTTHLANRLHATVGTTVEIGSPPRSFRSSGSVDRAGAVHRLRPRGGHARCSGGRGGQRVHRAPLPGRQSPPNHR